jgi:hypothetical protein
MDHFSAAVTDNGKVAEQTPPKTGLTPVEGRSPADGTEPATARSIGSSEHVAAAGGPPALEPLTPLQPRRQVDLTTAVLPELGNLAPVESLTVRELKGVGQTFTAQLDLMLAFHGLAYKGQNEYETQYQVIAPPLSHDPRVMSRVTRIAFVPGFAWATFEVVLLPIKLSAFGRRILDDLAKLKPRFPNYKSFIQWQATKKRHVVYVHDLSAQEASIIADVKWPTKHQILEALQLAAYDSLEDLMAANEEIRALVTSKEVK